MTERDSPAAHRERMYEAFADRRQPFDAAVESALDAGVGRLGVGIGFLTRIEDAQSVADAARRPTALLR